MTPPSSSPIGPPSLDLRQIVREASASLAFSYTAIIRNIGADVNSTGLRLESKVKDKNSFIRTWQIAMAK